MTHSNRNNLKISNTVWLLLFGTATIKAANFMSIPFIAIFLIKNSGLNAVEIGLIVALSPFASLMGGFLGGQLSDIFGRKNLLFISLSFLPFVFLGFYFSAELKDAHTRIIIFAVLNTLCGFFSSLFHPVSAALMGDLSPVELRGKIYQLRYFFTNIGAALGPALGGWLGINASRDNFLYTCYFYIFYFLILSFVFFHNRNNALTLTTVKRQKFKESYTALLGDKKLQRLILGGIVFNLCYSQIESTVAQIIANNFHDGIRYFSYLLTANGIIVISFQAPIYWLSRRMGLNISLVVGCGVFSVGMFLMAFQEISIIFLFVSIFFISIGEVFVFPISTELIEQLAPDSLRGSYFGAATFRNLGLSIGPIMGGYILTYYGSKSLFFTVSILAIVSVLVCLSGNKANLTALQRD
ncbi:MFS transporter [Iodobacter arcticus]|uniref:MFS transporter n=1 Tax=Iodobacter arcticus TaxID=590593 RepID=A0ABW2QUJ0_9NEIS